MTAQQPRRIVGNQNPSGLSLLELIAEDWRTHDSSPLEAGFWALAVHRFGNWRMDKPKPLRAPMTAAYNVMHASMIMVFGIDLGFSVKVGRRVRIWHHGGIHLGASSIGDDVHIRQNTTLGVRNRTELDGKPTIGDRVELGAGACVLGRVNVGDDAVVGPNSVVLRDIPAGSTVLGVPARPVDLNLNQGAAAKSPKWEAREPRRDVLQGAAARVVGAEEQAKLVVGDR